MNRPQRPYWRRYRARWYWVAIALVLIVQWMLNPPAASSPESLDEGIHVVRRVVDGDTLLLESGARVRLQGIDTPETVKENHPVEPWGPEASELTKQFIARAGGRVRLAFGQERRDDYGRFLAFVWNGEEMLNEELVRAGLARARLDYRYSGTMKRRLQQAQEEAQKAGRGIWSDANGAPDRVGP
jgi:micrococcal nuclease